MIDRIISDIEDIFKDIEAKRESLLSISRKIIRETKRIIHAIHDGSEADMTEVKELTEIILEITKGAPELSYLATDALAEFAETAMLDAAIHDRDIPSPDDLGVTPQAWVLGLADSIGELRRAVLDSLLLNDIEYAKRLFGRMERMYEAVMIFDVPDSIVQIRRKQDVARSIMDRTRTDVVTASLMR